LTAILNLRGRKANSGWKVDHCRSSSQYGRGSSQFVGRDAGELVGGDVADAVARGLHGVHFDARQFGQDVRRFLELRPVELHVLARREVPDAAVVAARDSASLRSCAAEHAVGDGDAQHRPCRWM
jgi:hypothetical protein